MEFKTDFTPEDYSGLCWFQARPASAFLSLLLTLALGFTVFGIAAMIIGPFAIGIGLVVALIGFPLIYKFQKRTVRKRADRRYNAVGASSELYLKINDDEILQTSQKGDTRLCWEDVYSVRESATSYYVFITKRKAFYFPKRSFESEAHREEFLGYIEKHVPEKKIKLLK